MTWTPTEPGAPSPLPTLPNLRDLGGWTGDGGRPVQYGRVFRSTDFRAVKDPSTVLAEVPLKMVYDLRTTNEITQTPDPKMTGVDDLHLDVLADLMGSSGDATASAMPAEMNAALADPEKLHELRDQMKSIDVVGKMSESYRSMVSSGSGKKAYRRFYEGLLHQDQQPALFHCTTGKDRTGWAAASFLSLMGVDRDDVYKDYLLTNDRLLPALKGVTDKWVAAGGTPDEVVPFLGVEKAYLDAAFDELEKNFGDVAGYFTSGLGLSVDQQGALRDKFLAG
ncbi:MAG: tyrosine-protein phosphatase [Gordonia sp. (in: high G+C Gram-positive bacteria)]|uniref:tyrosine-protein phosphatase n=1 Tax=Gordonia sp. (in: high G+C Gram-positive bacteria) TaxID=84139 RepID=UPI0039E703B0